MHLINGSFRIFLFLAAVLTVMLIPAWSNGAEDESCITCHKKYIAAEFKKSYIHKPFLEKKCSFCHSPDWVADAQDSDGKAQFPQKIKKLGSDENPSKTHLFSIPKEYNLSILFIEAITGSSPPYRVKLKVDDFESLNSLTSDAKPPEIYDIQVVEIKKDASISANIRWHTDELSNARVSYGIDHPEGQLVYSDQYLSDHTVELFPLNPDATYYFTITAEDIYGNSKESQVQSFSTAKSYAIDQSVHMENSPEPLKLKSDIFRSEENYLIRIAANQHIRIELSTYDLPVASLLLENSEVPVKDHPPMKSTYETNLLLCDMCHQALSQKFSHPVHFRARLGSNIPPGYPRLPNGQMSCLTCHDYHASNNAFHLRKSADRELCIGCHKRSFRR